MFFVWRGYGIIVPIVFFIAAWITSFWIDDTTIGNKPFMGWSSLSSGVLIVLLSVVFLQGETIDTDSETDIVSEKRPKHDFFFIPITFWGIALVILSLYLLLF